MQNAWLKFLEIMIVYVLVWIQGMGEDICFCYKNPALVDFVVS